MTELMINISAAETLSDELVSNYYPVDKLQTILVTTLNVMNEQQASGVSLPYFSELDTSLWQDKSKELGVYLTDIEEGRNLNLEARDKDYATNILSYPSDLPPFILQQMPTIPLGELIICHEVVATQAQEQNKSTDEHITHLIVHGILHLLGFDHELGQAEQDEMESFEIAILEKLGVSNPYIAR